jgi:hypothetical protein
MLNAPGNAKMENTVKVWTKVEIKDMLVSNDNWLVRGLLAIFNCQTATEQEAGITAEDNGIGFNGADAEILSSFAKFYKKNGYLSPKQREICRKKMAKYAGQLEKIANGKI